MPWGFESGVIVALAPPLVCQLAHSCLALIQSLPGGIWACG